MHISHSVVLCVPVVTRRRCIQPGTTQGTVHTATATRVCKPGTNPQPKAPACTMQSLDISGIGPTCLNRASGAVCVYTVSRKLLPTGSSAPPTCRELGKLQDLLMFTLQSMTYVCNERTQTCLALFSCLTVRCKSRPTLRSSKP